MHACLKRTGRKKNVLHKILVPCSSKFLFVRTCSVFHSALADYSTKGRENFKNLADNIVTLVQLNVSWKCFSSAAGDSTLRHDQFSAQITE